jgi:L-lactate dehydrogenase complex protein LldG
MTPRETFLGRVRQAVQEGNRAGAASPLPDRRGVGYQGAGADAIQRFCDELTKAGGIPYLAPDQDTACRIVLDLVRTKGARKAVLSRCPLLDQLDLGRRLHESGTATTTVDNLPAGTAREAFFGADIGISGVHRLIAETGTVVMATSAAQPRSISLLPPIHIAVAEASQLLPDLFDLFDLFSPLPTPQQSEPPSCLTLITGPSKTGDIELRLVTGVHGPGEIHVVLCV